MFACLKETLRSLTKGELALWGLSAGAIFLSFLLFDRENLLTLGASLVGTASLIFNAKGNPLGQALMVIFSLLYGIISWSFSYYGEMLTYLGMTAPMAVLALISWLKNPAPGQKAQVKVSSLRPREPWFLLAVTCLVTFLFYFVLRAFHTANLLPSTLSVATSFLAAYLTFRRSPYFALWYGGNDLVLILLWGLAAEKDPAYLSVAVCFVMFFCQ